MYFLRHIYNLSFTRYAQKKEMGVYFLVLFSYCLFSFVTEIGRRTSIYTYFDDENSPHSNFVIYLHLLAFMFLSGLYSGFF